ncbi:MAG: thioesterase family protein [Bacteroidetes bacterium]|nr:thioesterase family protein [Bacteroidota bacterium]
MATFRKRLSLRWSDLDPNFHLRHSSYYDLAATFRVELLDQMGLTLQVMKEQHFGPVLFREEAVFLKEIRIADNVDITAALVSLTPDGAKWSVMHEFIDDKDVVRARLTVDGAWIDTQIRKIAKPTAHVAIDVFNALPKIEVVPNTEK